MDQALVEDAEDDVDGEERRRDEDRLVGERRLERLGRALEAAADAAGRRISASGALNGVDGRAERDADGRLKEMVTDGNCPWWFTGAAPYWRS